MNIDTKYENQYHVVIFESNIILCDNNNNNNEFTEYPI